MDVLIFQCSTVPILIGVFLLGLVLLVSGIRGRRLDDHRICTRCRYDLTGVANDAAVCPECGASLASPRAVRIGNRRWQPGQIVVGGLLMLLVAVPMGLVVQATLSSVNLNPWKPLWLLRWQALSTRLPGADGAINELRVHRLASMTSAEAEALLDDVLALQADVSRPWRGKWGDLVWEMHERGLGRPQQYEDYARHLYTHRLVVRTPVAVGNTIPIAIEQDMHRGHGDTHHFFFWLHHEAAVVGGRRHGLHGGHGGTVTTTTSLDALSGDGATLDLSPGIYNFRVEFRLEVHRGDDTGPLLLTMPIALETDVEIVEPAADPTHFIVDPVLGAQVERSVRMGQRVHHAVSRSRAEVQLGPLPVELAYEITVVAPDGRTWRLGSIRYAGSMRTHGYGFKCPPLDADVTSVDIHFTPSLDVARQTVDILTPLDHPFVVRGVVVEP